MVSKRFINFIVFIFLFQTVLGIDSEILKDKLNNATTDTAKVMIYSRYANEVMGRHNRNYRQVQHFTSQGGINPYYHQALQIAKEGLLLAEQIEFEQGRAELHRTIGNAYFHLNDNNKALENYEKSLEICEKIEDENGVALNYYNIALVYNRKKQNVLYSLEILNKALNIWKKTENKDRMYRAYTVIIQMYREVGEFITANTYAEEALKLAIESGDRHEEASLYYRLAQINYSFGNVKAQEEYYQKSLELYEALGEQLQMANIMHIMATTLYLPHSEIAIDLLLKSVDIYETMMPNNRQLFQIYNSIATAYYKNNELDSAKKYKEKALSKAILSDNLHAMAEAYNVTGTFYAKYGDIERATKDLRKAYEIAQKTGLYHIRTNVLSKLSLIYYQKGDYKTAVEYMQRHRDVNDSMNEKEIRRQIDHLAMQYEFEKEVNEQTLLLNTQLKLHQKTIEYQRNRVLIVSIALIISFILLLMIIRSNNLKNKAYKELTMYKENLEEMVIEQTDKILQREKQLQTISNNLPDGCIYQKLLNVDGKENITYISNTAELCLGISAEKIVENINILYNQIVPEDLENKRKIEQASALSMTSYSCEFRLKKGKNEMWILENAMPRTDNDNIVWDGAMVDITERKRNEIRAEESDRLKSAFLANMSHEIRTPMNGIVGLLNYIEHEDMTPESRSTYFNIINNNVHQLLQLIDDLVDISKMDSLQMTLNNSKFNLNVLFEELEIFYQDFILKNDKDLTLKLNRCHFIEPCFIYSDQVRLRQVISNLIGNAIKFTEKGYITFGYSMSENKDYLYFFVDDTGIGIHQSKQIKIFEKFMQGHKDTQVLYSGTGLGLTISKNLVELMGGEIGVESEEGVGSKFYFTLPAECIQN